MENTNFYLYNYLPKELLSKEGKKSTEKLKEISLIGLYFGALSCPPCNYFTRLLKKFYEKSNEKEKKVEIIYCSLDESQEDFDEYYSKMPWLSLSYDDENLEKMGNDFSIEGVPVFFIFTGKGKLVDIHGKKIIEKQNEEGLNIWLEKAKNLK